MFSDTCAMSYAQRTEHLLARTRGTSINTHDGTVLLEAMRAHLQTVTEQLRQFYENWETLTPVQRKDGKCLAEENEQLRQSLDAARELRNQEAHRRHRILAEIDRRIDKGALSNGHLELLRDYICNESGKP